MVGLLVLPQTACQPDVQSKGASIAEPARSPHTLSREACSHLEPKWSSRLIKCGLRPGVLGVSCPRSRLGFVLVLYSNRLNAKFPKNSCMRGLSLLGGSALA